MSSHCRPPLHTPPRSAQMENASAGAGETWTTGTDGRGMGGGGGELSHNDTPLSVAARLPCPNDAAACVFLLTHYGMPVLSSAGAGSGGLGSSLVVGGGKGAGEGGSSSSGVATNSLQTMSPRMALFYKVGHVCLCGIVWCCVVCVVCVCHQGFSM